jgi:DHA2 family multidrug resistance protein
VAIDWFGVGLLALGLGSLQFVLDNGERADWFSDATILTAAIVSTCAIAMFGWWQWSGTNRPVVDLHVLRFRSVWVGSLIALAFGALIFGPAIVTPLYSSSILQYTAWDSGLLLVARAAPVVVLTPVFATMAQGGTDVRYLLGGGFVLSALSLWWMQSVMTSASPFAALAWPLLVSGVGQSMLLVPLIVGVLSTTPAALNGKISPIITLCVQLGGSIISAGSIAFFDRRTSFHATILSGAAGARHLAMLGYQPTRDAVANLAALVNQQATTMGFADTILAIGVLAAVVVPLVLAFPRSKAFEG